MRAISTLVGCPPLFADQGNEADIGDILAAILIGRNPGDTDQFLAALIRTDRNHQPAADLQLFLERFRNHRSAGGHDDGIIGGMVRPSTCAVAVEDMNIVVTEFGQGLGGLFGERPEPLDRVDISRDLREHRGGVTGPGTDLKDFFPAL